MIKVTVVDDGKVKVSYQRSGTNINVKVECDDLDLLLTHPKAATHLQPAKGTKNPPHIQYPASRGLRKLCEELFGWGRE